MENIVKPAPEMLKLPLEVRAEMALKAAVDEVIEEHARNGWPLYIWRNGGVVAVSPEELREQSSRRQ
jgi:hypothetical protein